VEEEYKPNLWSGYRSSQTPVAYRFPLQEALLEVGSSSEEYEADKLGPEHTK